MTPLIAFSLGFAVRHAAGKIANWLGRRALRDAKARQRADVTSRVEGDHRNYYREGTEIHRHDVGRN